MENKMPRVLPITSNPLVKESVVSALEASTDYFLIDANAAIEDHILDVIVSLQPDFILLDFEYDRVDALTLIDSITLQFPEIVVIVLLPQSEIAQSNNIILAGARAFLLEPFTQTNLLETLGRVKELIARTTVSPVESSAAQQPAGTQGTVVVFSPRGGAGCTSVAINLALAMFEKMKEEMLLVDGKLQFGHLDVMLNLRTQNTISELIAHVGALDETLIRDVVTEHVSGLKLLPAPPSISAAQGIRAEDLYTLVTHLQSVFQNIIIDGGNFLNENAVTFMDASSKVILVINPDIASLRDAAQFFDVCRTLAYPKEKILVLVNQYDKRDGLSLDDIEKSLQVKIFGTIPWDHRIAINSINRGVPVTLQRQNSNLRKAYQTLAKDVITQIKRSGSARPSKKQSSSDALSKSSRLG